MVLEAVGTVDEGRAASRVPLGPARRLAEDDALVTVLTTRTGGPAAFAEAFFDDSAAAVGFADLLDGPAVLVCDICNTRSSSSARPASSATAAAVAFLDVVPAGVLVRVRELAAAVAAEVGATATLPLSLVDGMVCVECSVWRSGKSK